MPKMAFNKVCVMGASIIPTTETAKTASPRQSAVIPIACMGERMLHDNHPTTTISMRGSHALGTTSNNDSHPEYKKYEGNNTTAKRLLRIKTLASQSAIHPGIGSAIARLGACGEITRENLEMYAIKSSCLGCIYVSGDKLLPCAIHPKEQSEDCPDKTFI
ncbi:MAG: hypothetical protein AAF630_07120 [Cyanobacteria bacterium P01_C01_bin.38]